jgi:hypothetical protein
MSNEITYGNGGGGVYTWGDRATLEIGGMFSLDAAPTPSVAQHETRTQELVTLFRTVVFSGGHDRNGTLPPLIVNLKFSYPPELESYFLPVATAVFPSVRQQR